MVDCDEFFYISGIKSILLQILVKQQMRKVIKDYFYDEKYSAIVSEENIRKLGFIDDLFVK
ncbi:MAG: hypothetical protein PUI46_10455 [Lachnospiraceae bacterium]|nr:hypothetical protein [Lachnospiraceae bacterium]